MKKSGNQIRLTNSQRQKKYIDEMDKQGYKKSSVYMTVITKEFFKEFCHAQSCTQHGAVEMLIDNYQRKELSHNVRDNKIIEQKQTVDKITQKTAPKIDELEFEPDIKTPLSGDLPLCHHVRGGQG